MNMIQDSLYNLIKSRAKEGTLIIKIDELASGIGEGRGPTYTALQGLVKNGKIETFGRGKKGVQIKLVPTQNKTDSLNGSNPDNKETMTIKVSNEGLSEFIASASEGTYKIIEDLIAFNRLKRKKKN
ncbi:MAG: hypothetical protein JSV88_27050 [Candidatus Aminicenantes bacterium]|nr:MAG: hypothetical protein JSV88_27050 [Candidatus Aminicenantes bacterium]